MEPGGRGQARLRLWQGESAAARSRRIGRAIDSGGKMDPAGLVEATERLYRSLFAAALGLALGTALWGSLISPFNGFSDDKARSVGLGALLAVAGLIAFARRRALFVLLRRYPLWLLAVVALTLAVLWLDGGWHSSYYLASYAAIGLAAVVGGLRWSLICAVLLTTGYIAGLALNGYSWAELRHLSDADSVIADAGGYLVAACFLAMPVGWLGGYVARIHQIVGDVERNPGAEPLGEPTAEEPVSGVTNRLSVREVEVVQLVAGGATNDEIAQQFVLSVRTIQSHVENAMRKTGTRNRTELAVLAVGEGLVPARCEPPESLPLAPGKAPSPSTSV
jgi:DNA-binding CsgD family transcriptional regulator